MPMPRSVQDEPQSPIVRFTVDVLDAPTPADVARRCAEGLVRIFEVPFAQVHDESHTWAEAGRDDDAHLRVCFPLSAPGAPLVELVVGIEWGPDAGIWRQQLMDLAAVVRRAFRDRVAMALESRRAREDELTGLHNRRALDERLEEAVLAARQSFESLTVMLVDLDHFKEVNDTQGHAAGDHVLRFAATCLRAHLREGDLVTRLGGDEFLVLAMGLDARTATTVAERLREAFAQASEAKGTTMSIGVADLDALPPAQRTAKDLLAKADESLYASKRAGRNRVTQASALRQSA